MAKDYKFGDAIEKREGARVWMGERGMYIIPSRFADVRMTRIGLPDKRTTRCAEFMAWVSQQEEKAVND